MNRFLALTLMVVLPVAGVLLTVRPIQVGAEQDPTLESSLTVLDAAAILHREAQKRQKLDAQFARVALRIARKREIARNVIAGSLSLSEASLLFRDILADCEYAELVYDANSGATVEERLGRDVIGWVAGELTEDQARQTAEVERLEAELRMLLNPP